MSVLIETSVGVVAIDLFCDDAPVAAKNFLKLCKIKVRAVVRPNAGAHWAAQYYNNCIFHNVQRDLLVQTGDPTWKGDGGESVYASLYGPQARYFEGEVRPARTHARAGTVSMAVAGRLGERPLHGSQWFITTRDGLHHLDASHTVVGTVAEGMDVVQAINEAYADDRGGGGSWRWGPRLTSSSRAPVSQHPHQARSGT